MHDNHVPAQPGSSHWHVLQAPTLHDRQPSLWWLLACQGAAWCRSPTPLEWPSPCRCTLTHMALAMCPTSKSWEQSSRHLTSALVRLQLLPSRYCAVAWTWCWWHTSYSTDQGSDCLNHGCVLHQSFWHVNGAHATAIKHHLLCSVKYGGMHALLSQAWVMHKY